MLYLRTGSQRAPLPFDGLRVIDLAPVLSKIAFELIGRCAEKKALEGVSRYCRGGDSHTYCW